MEVNGTLNNTSYDYCSDDELVIDPEEYTTYLIQVHSLYWSLKEHHENIVSSYNEELKIWKNKYLNTTNELKLNKEKIKLFSNALRNCNLDQLDDDSMMNEIKLFMKSNIDYYCDAHYVETIENELKHCKEDIIINNELYQYQHLIIIIILFYFIYKLFIKSILSFIAKMIDILRSLTFRKIRFYFKNKMVKFQKFTINKNIILPIKQWFLRRKCVIFMICKKKEFSRWIELKTLEDIDWNKWKTTDWNKWKMTRKGMEDKWWYNWINIDYISCKINHTLLIHSKYNEMESELAETKRKYEKIEKEKMNTDSIIKSRENRINELCEETDDLHEHYEVILMERDKNIEILKKDNNTLGAQLAVESMENRKLIKVLNEYRETDGIIIDLKEEMDELKEEMDDLKEKMIDLQSKLRKKSNELRNIKGNNNYLIWNGDDIVDWMMIQQKGRFRTYENTLRSSMKIECISGAQFVKLKANDLYRLGIKGYDDKLTMLGLMKDFIKNNKNKREDPEELCDPITFELMKEPVLVTVSGRTYDKNTIKSIIKKGDKEPFSGHKINNKHLISNKLVKELIRKYNDCKLIINQ